MTASRRALIIVAVLIGVAFGLPWGGAVPTASAQTIQVIAADPPSGEQGALNLNVLIKGKGFKNGAKAKFYRTGSTDPDGINVKSTKYVSSTQLLATIDIADWATLSLFDIEVALADGRTGKGTELFSVTAKQVDPCTLPDPVPTLNDYTSGPPGIPGYLDSTFGDSATGKVIGRRDMLPGYVYGEPLAADSLGRVVVVSGTWGTCSSPHPEWIIARYLPDGNLDASFGAGGVVMPGGDVARGVLVQPDNKIVVAGVWAQPRKIKSGCAGVARFNEDGSLDTGFGSGGIACAPGGTSANSVTLQPDGKIVAAGTSGYTGFVSRLNPDGTLDTTFNGGAVQISGRLAFDAVATRTVSGEQRIVVAGFYRELAPDGTRIDSAALWQFTNSGALDDGFGTVIDPMTGVRSGMVKTSFASGAGDTDNVFYDVTVDSSNRIVAAGYTGWPTARLAVGRYDLAGDLDPSFGNGGIVLASSGQTSVMGRAVAIQSDGSIVAAGNSSNYDDAGNRIDLRAGVWRFTDGGVPDATFGDAGWASDPITSGTTFLYLTGMILHNGKIVCVGYFGMPSDLGVPHAFLARFWQ